MHDPLRIFIAVIAGTMFIPASAFGSDLSSYRWKNRLLLLFSPAGSEPAYAAFHRSVTEAPLEVKDRDLIVFRIFERNPSYAGQQKLAPEDAAALRRRFNVRAGRFTVVLVGKDGGVKLVREQQATLGEIFDLIDSMPMRQQEMREKGHAR